MLSFLNNRHNRANRREQRKSCFQKIDEKNVILRWLLAKTLRMYHLCYKEEVQLLLTMSTELKKIYKRIGWKVKKYEFWLKKE